MLEANYLHAAVCLAILWHLSVTIEIYVRIQHTTKYNIYIGMVILTARKTYGM